MTAGGQPKEDLTKPVAYDQYGRPLYAHPPEVAAAETVKEEPAPQVVYLSRSLNPHKQVISDDIKAKHDESKRRYPQLNLSDGEYVISAVRRHPIGLISIWAVVSIAVIMILGIPALLGFAGVTLFTLSASAALNGMFVLLMLVILAIMSGVVATVIYDANRFFLTNESVIQHIQNGLFSKNDQTISLSNIEDASFRQVGILQTILNYGSIRLSTEGEETTYRFHFAANPEEQIRLLNNAVEAFKNYRPIGSDSTDD